MAIYDKISSTNKKRDIPVSIGVGRGISPKAKYSLIILDVF